MRIVAWDFEVKQDWWCVTFGEKIADMFSCEEPKDLDYITFQSGQELDLIDYIIKNKNDCIFVGYNSTHFDNWCLKCIWYGINPWKVVHQVIELGGYPHLIKELQYKKNIDFKSFDLMQAIGVNANSLKDVEACMGIEIMTDSLVDKVTGLTKEERETTIKYNRHDVYATMCLYDRLEGYLESYIKLCEKFNLPNSTYSRKKSQMFEIICQGKFKKNLTPYSFKYKAPSFIKLIDNTVKDAMESFMFTADNEFDCKIDWDGYDYIIKRGGAHYAKKNYVQTFDGKTILGMVDFASFYPGEYANPTNPELRYIDPIINWQEMRALVDMRLAAKKTDKTLAEALKIPVNAAYGKMIAPTFPYSYWPAGLSVCLTGQLITMMICQELKQKGIGKLIQVNTDGFYYQLKKSEKDEFNKVMDDFQAKIGIEFERDFINKGKIVQKDVNNYIILNEETGEVKAKGALNKYKSKVDYYQNTKSIVAEAIAENLIHGVPVNKTIMDAWNNNEARKFQIVYNVKGKNYEGCYYGNKKIQKINRGFASADKNLPDIRKLKGATYAKFPDAPDHVLIYNGDLKDFDVRKVNLDIQYYINLAQDGVKNFMGEI